MSNRLNLTGVASNVKFGKGGARIRNSGVNLQVRNAIDGDFTNMQGANAIAAQDFVTFTQFQAGQNGLGWKNPARYGTVAPLSPANTITGGGATLTATGVGVLSIDGDPVVLGDRVLVMDEVNGIKNGVYDCTVAGEAGVAYELTRAVDMALGADAASNALFVQEGAVNLDTAFTCTNDQGAAVVGTDALVFILFSSVVSGVTSIADAPSLTGVGMVATGGAPVPTIYGVLGSGAINAALVTDDVVLTLNAEGVTNGFIGGNAVTEDKVAALAGTFYRRIPFSYLDANSVVNVGLALPANAVVLSSTVKITTQFDAPMDMTLGISGTPALLMRTAEIAEQELPDVYIVDDDEDGAAGSVVELNCVASAATAGAGIVSVMFMVSA